MSKRKRFRGRQIGRSGPIAETTRKINFLTDGEARFDASLWAVSLTFGYGIFNSLILNRPEARVNKEALIVCIGTLFIRLLIYYVADIRADVAQQITQRMWSAIQRLSGGRSAQRAGVAGLTFALVLSAAPIGRIEPALAVRHIEKSNIGLVPGMDADLTGTDPALRFVQVSNQIQKAIQQRNLADPETIRQVKDSLARIVENVRLPQDVASAARMELAYLQSYESLSRIGAENPNLLRQLSSGIAPGMPVVIGQGPDKSKFIATPNFNGTFFTSTDRNPKFFSDFSVMNFGHAPDKPLLQFAVTNGDNTTTVFNNIKIQGFAQDIGNLTWTNVDFIGSVIRYHGQPVRMGNAQFFNCTFERSQDGRGQQLLDYLAAHQGESVNIYVP